LVRSINIVKDRRNNTPWRTPTDILAIEKKNIDTNLEMSIRDIEFNDKKVYGMKKKF